MNLEISLMTDTHFFNQVAHCRHFFVSVVLSELRFDL